MNASFGLDISISYKGVSIPSHVATLVKQSIWAFVNSCSIFSINLQLIFLDDMDELLIGSPRRRYILDAFYPVSKILPQGMGFSEIRFGFITTSRMHSLMDTHSIFSSGADDPATDDTGQASHYSQKIRLLPSNAQI